MGKNALSIAFSLFLLVAVVSCRRNDFSQFTAGKCFTANINGKELVIKLNDVQTDKIAGSYYFTNALFADPHPFTVESRGNKVILRTSAFSDPVKLKWEQEEGLTFQCRSGELPQEFVLEQCAARDSVLFSNQLRDTLYAFKPILNVEYARADGFWTGYPDEDKSFAEIYAGRLPQLLQKQEQSLLMDIYEPLDNSDALHPLVLMIHGGAFYNGDKQDETYKKWCRHFASLGYVAVSLNYRMGFPPFRKAIDRAGYRATQDANAALRFLVHNAREYRINPDLIFTWGTSAGAITALNVAFMDEGEQPESVLKEGKLNKLAPECTESFRVRAVANMWGAVHDTAILNNRDIAVISFHSDRDGIVPYGYGIPFKDELISTMTNEIREKIAQFMTSMTNARDRVSRWTESSVSQSSTTFTTRSFGDPMWELVFTPMYGSSCVDTYLKRHGGRSKLFPVPGTKHSLHVDEHRNIVPYFYTIQDTVAKFFYEVIVPRPVNLQQDELCPQYFRICNADVAEEHWQVEGGILLSGRNGNARVVFFHDASRHVLRVSGKYKNGVEFCEEKVL